MQFTKATRKKSKLRLALTGPSGSGKTMSALLLASGLGGRIAVLDTERGSASLYSHVADFDVLELEPPFEPERFIAAIDAAEAGGYSTLILDSITHEWNGVGGCMELVDRLAASKYKGNTWRAFDEITPRHRAFLDRILRSRLHIIATMRSKTETAQVDEGGKKKVVKLGMKSEQRDGSEYEFTTVLDISHDGHYALASKDRTGLFGAPIVISEATGTMLLEWLDSGKDIVGEHIAAINAAATIEELAEAFAKAYEYAKNCGDVAARDQFTQAKDARKRALENPAGKDQQQADGDGKKAAGDKAEK